VQNLFCCDWSAKFILRLGVQNLFCGYWSAKFILRLGVQNLFCGYWSTKFILRLLEYKIYFAAIGVQNLFCFGAFFGIGWWASGRLDLRDNI